jgi:hypothetical protein
MGRVALGACAAPPAQLNASSTDAVSHRARSGRRVALQVVTMRKGTATELRERWRAPMVAGPPSGLAGPAPRAVASRPEKRALAQRC